MLIQKLICFLRGYLVIQADSCFPERFINICIRRNILLWDIKKLGDMRMRANISIRAFPLLREIARKTRTHIEIADKRGLPFFMHRYRKRRFAAAGLAVFLLMMWYFSTHVMGITVIGNERVSEAVITECMERFGVRLGVRLNSFDTDLLQNQMMTDLADIAWVGAALKGSRLYVEVRERLEPLARIDQNTPCNLVAEHDGVISGLEVREGQTLVKVNDAVTAGDLLVSGIMDSASQGMRYVHSFGDIYATTWYKKEGEYPLQYEEKIETGNVKKRYRAQILKCKVNFYFNGRPPYSVYEKIETKQEYSLPIDIFPSLFWSCDTYTEQQVVQKSRTEQETIEFAAQELKAQIESELPPDAEVRNIAVTHTASDQTVRVAVEYECRENIAKQSMIDKIDVLPYDIGEVQNNSETTQENPGQPAR
uniref:Sporulation protein YqfD n=1 Tax=uncultured Bacillota bacterium TaxID=344338 RepID=A0A650EN40_9FIRM|nr:sporulation protein YqfD [uncultured Firmicutes bacterium]